MQVYIVLFISVINQLDAQNYCFTISLFHASTCFEHMCSSSGGQNRITNIYSLFISVNGSTCNGWYLQPSSGAYLTVSTAFDINNPAIHKLNY